jgi:hypothetical protein
VNPGYDFYIFEGNKNCYEGKEYAVFLCRMAEASYIMQPKKITRYKRQQIARFSE